MLKVKERVPIFVHHKQQVDHMVKNITNRRTGTEICGEKIDTENEKIDWMEEKEIGGKMTEDKIAREEIMKETEVAEELICLT